MNDNITEKSLAETQGAKAVLVFSYRRFSAKKQELGDSLRRQIELGEEWITRHHYTPASLTLHDLGVSAFRGKNKHSGALGKFLDAIEEGRVPKGSILLVENLDRLSRQGMDEAGDLFKSIVKAGVKIAVLRPYEIVYTKEALNDPLGLFIPLMYFHLAYVESKNKSERLRKAWDHKRADAAEGSLRHFDKRRPSWLDFDGADFVLNERAAAVKRIFEMTAEGRGQHRVMRAIVEEFPSMKWTGSFITKVLSDRSVLGERQPKTLDDDGNRVSIGKPLEGYYPPAIDESLWYRAQTAKARNKKAKGPNGDFVNLFTSLVTNAHDHHVMHCQRSPLGDKVQRRLVSYGHLSKLPGTDPVSVEYYSFETAMLAHLNEINPADLEPKASRSALDDKKQELEGVEKRLGELTAAMSDPSIGNLVALATAARKLEVRVPVLKGEIEILKAELHADAPLRHAQSLVKALADAPGEKRHEMRLRLRSLIAELVEEILVKPEKHYGRVFALIQIRYRSGLVKQITLGPNHVGYCKEAVTPCYFAIDLSKDASGTILAGYARLVVRPDEDVVLPNSVPSTLGLAAEHWLLLAKRRMRPESFRVVPSKIRRFVGLVGAELALDRLNARYWKKWQKYIKEQLEKKTLSAATARVAYSRVREMVRWFIEAGMVRDFEELKETGGRLVG